MSYVERRAPGGTFVGMIVTYDLSSDAIGDGPMIRRFRMALAAGALFAMLLAASPVAAAGNVADGGCVAHHAKAEGGFSGEHNPGAMHRGFAGSHEICSHT